ncbi:IS5 family transposase, partial [Streptomyces sp. NPDC059556]|uniref:IS5 family transposase n=1 Tax=Streptomyces sp. NPDC059556 TaxID=3346863 RepID=UPI0036B6CD49
MLTDAQWARIEPLLPDRTPRRGGRWRDHRQVIDAIAWKYRTGSPWMDLPAEFGSWKGAYSRLRNWAIDGTWERVFTTLLAQADADEDLSWVVSVDSTVVGSQNHSGGGRAKGGPPARPPAPPARGPPGGAPVGSPPPRPAPGPAPPPGPRPRPIAARGRGPGSVAAAPAPDVAARRRGGG